MTSAAGRTGPVRYPERRHSQCRFARRSDACRRGRPSCVPRFGASWSETLPEKRRWLNRQFVPSGRLYVRCGCRAVRLYPYRSSRPPPARYIPRHARPRRYRTSTLSRICTPGNPSRVGGDKRMGTRGTAKILPRCFGRSDRRAQYCSLWPGRLCRLPPWESRAVQGSAPGESDRPGAVVLVPWLCPDRREPASGPVGRSDPQRCGPEGQSGPARPCRAPRRPRRARATRSARG